MEETAGGTARRPLRRPLLVRLGGAPGSGASSARREHDIDVVAARLRIRQKGGEGGPTHDVSAAFGALAVADGDDFFVPLFDGRHITPTNNNNYASF